MENTSNNVRPTTGQYRYIVFHSNQEQEEYITDYAQELRDFCSKITSGGTPSRKKKSY